MASGAERPRLDHQVINVMDAICPTRGTCKKGRGAIRFVQILFLFCAMATVLTCKTKVGFCIKCNDYGGSIPKNETVAITAQYPFAESLDDEPKVDGPQLFGKNFESRLSRMTTRISILCASLDPESRGHSRRSAYEVRFLGNVAGNARYFVATGAITAIYIFVSVIVYVRYDRDYQSSSRMPPVDLAMTIVLTVMWLTSSLCLGTSIYQLENDTDSETLYKINSRYYATFPEMVSGIEANFSMLNVAVLFGSMNALLWALNCWYVLKETSWYADGWAWIRCRGTNRPTPSSHQGRAPNGGLDMRPPVELPTNVPIRQGPEGILTDDGNDVEEMSPNDASNDDEDEYVYFYFLDPMPRKPEAQIQIAADDEHELNEVVVQV